MPGHVHEKGLAEVVEGVGQLAVVAIDFVWIPSFLPKPLPPESPILMDFELQSLRSEADCALGRLDGSMQP
jgi:hypothetical protein